MRDQPEYLCSAAAADGRAETSTRATCAAYLATILTQYHPSAFLLNNISSQQNAT